MNVFRLTGLQLIRNACYRTKCPTPTILEHWMFADLEEWRRDFWAGCYDGVPDEKPIEEVE